LEPAGVEPASSSTAADVVSSSAPAIITVRSPNRSVACPEGTASSSGTIANEAASAPSQPPGTSSSMAR
jgi:hypothetical protein